MSSLLDALSDSENTIDLQDENLITPIHEFLEINPEKRLITIPESEQLFGVYGENKVEIKYFKCPRIILNDIDLYECYIFINYISASGKIGYIQADTVVLDETENYIIFTWELTRNVFDENTDADIYFSISAKQYLEDKEPVFFTRKAKGNLYETVYAEEQITEQYADIILQLLAEMDGVKQIATPEAINVQKVDCVVDVESDSIGIIDIGCLPSNFGVGDYIIDSEETIWKITSIDSNAIVKLTTDDISQVTKNTIKIDKLSEEIDGLKLSSDIVFESVTVGEVMTSTTEEPNEPEEPDTPIEPDATYTITRNLTGCVSDNSVTTINEGSVLTEKFTAKNNYTLDGATVSVTMSGVDISSKYVNGVLTVASVTGDIVITIKANYNAVVGSGTLVKKVTNENGNSYFDILDLNYLTNLGGTYIIADSYKNEKYQNYRINNTAMTEFLDFDSENITNSLIPQVVNNGANDFVNNTAEGVICSIYRENNIFLRLPIDLGGYNTPIEYLHATYGHLPLAMNSEVVEKVIDPNLITSMTVKTDDDTKQYAQFGYSDLPSVNIYKGLCSLSILTGTNANLSAHVPPRFAISTFILSCEFEPHTFEEFTLENVKQYLTDNSLVFWYIP